MKNVKQAIIVRKDLKLRRATVASLTSQAATKFLTENNESDRLDELYVKLSYEEVAWLQGSGEPVILGVESQLAIDDLIFRAKLLGISVHSITGSYAKSREDDSVLCAAFGPDDEELINRIIGKLKSI